MPIQKSRGPSRLLIALALSVITATLIVPSAAAQSTGRLTRFPAEPAALALVERAARALDRQPLRPVAGPAGASRATRQIVKPGSPRDVLVGFYEITAGRAPRLVALEWGRDVQRPGGCRNGGTAIEVATFLLIWPPNPGPWAGLRYTGCLGPNGRLTGPPTEQPLPLDDPATRALSHTILTRLTPKL